MPRRCPACGRHWGAEATFCGACGAMLDVADTDPSRSRDVGREPPGRRVALLIAVIVVIASGIIAWQLVPGVVGGQDVDDDTVALPTAAPDTTASEAPRPLRCTRDGVPVGGCLAWDVVVGGGVSLGPRLPGAPLLVNTGPSGITVRDPDTGEVRWHRGDVGDVRPLLAADDVLVVTGNGIARGLGVHDGTDRWSHDGVRPVGRVVDLEPPLAILGRRAEGRDVRGLVALDPATGDLVWEWSVPWSGTVGSSIVAAGPDGLLVTGGGRLARVDVATGETVWSAPTLEHAYLQAQPPRHVTAQQLGEAASPDLWVHEVATGEVAHRMPANTVMSHLVVDDVIVLHAPSAGVLQARLLGDDEPMWSRVLGGSASLGFPVDPAGRGAVILLERDARRVTRLDPETGAPLWVRQLQPARASRGSSTFLGQPMVVGDMVVVEDTSNVVTVLDLRTGRERVRVDAGPGANVRSLDPLTLVDGDRWMRVAVPPAGFDPSRTGVGSEAAGP